MNASTHLIKQPIIWFHSQVSTIVMLILFPRSSIFLTPGLNHPLYHELVACYRYLIISFRMLLFHVCPLFPSILPFYCSTQSLLDSFRSSLLLTLFPITRCSSFYIPPDLAYSPSGGSTWLIIVLSSSRLVFYLLRPRRVAHLLIIVLSSSRLVFYLLRPRRALLVLSCVRTYLLRPRRAAYTRLLSVTSVETVVFLSSSYVQSRP